MSSQAGDDIAVAITIHVVGEHVCSTGFAEFHLVQFPLRVAGAVCRLFEPTVFEQHVSAAIAVDVAYAECMTEAFGSDVV